MEGTTIASLQAHRAMIDGELEALGMEREQVEVLTEQLQRRRRWIEGRWRSLITRRDRADQALWDALWARPAMRPPVPPDVSAVARSSRPTDPAPEPWDFGELTVLRTG